MSVIVKYDSNNSGGSFWLSTEDWEALAKAGWNVHWYDPNNRWGGRPASAYEEPMKACIKVDGVEVLGALASSAAKEFDNPADAIPEFERITGQDASDVGCNCCGPPHSFEYEDQDGKTHYASAYVTETSIGFA
jgi:hypothetical protein